MPFRHLVRSISSFQLEREFIVVVVGRQKVYQGAVAREPISVCPLTHSLNHLTYNSHEISYQNKDIKFLKSCTKSVSRM